MSTGTLRRSGQLARTRHQRPQSMGSSDALRVQPNYSNDLIQNSLSQQVNSRVFRLLAGAGRGFAWAVLFRLTRKTPLMRKKFFSNTALSGSECIGLPPAFEENPLLNLYETAGLHKRIQRIRGKHGKKETDSDLSVDPVCCALASARGS